MNGKRLAKTAISLFLFATILFFASNIVFSEQVNIIAGRESEVAISSILNSIDLAQNDPIIQVNGIKSQTVTVNSNQNVKLFSQKEGKYPLKAYILGVPYKTVTVNVLPDIKLYPGGELIGININTKGIIAVGFEEIKTDGDESVSPAKQAKIMIGDVIQKVNGVQTNTAESFRKEINSDSNQGKTITLSVLRSEVELEITIIPVTSAQDGTNFIGLWVRDNIAGIGTLTYVSEDMKTFGALGHAVTDVTSGITVPVEQGELIGAQIINLVKGEKNTPGEIKGIIGGGDKSFGTVTANNEFGLFGLYRGGLIASDKEPMPIALQSEIKEGKATILTTVDDSLKKYEIYIEKVHRQNTPDTKSMSIRVTDPELLKKTGGIIQGMSGSPIIQNGKIIGAVTHVLVNDPTRGYAVFAEWMIENNMN